MTEQENKELVQQFYDELFNQKNLAIVDDCLPDNYVCHDNMGGGRKEVQRNPEGVKEMVRMLCSAFPDQKTTIDEISVKEDRVATRWTIRGTQYGDFMGIAPTRRQIAISGTCLDRVIDGKIVESWVNWDVNDLLRQLEVEEWKIAA